MRADLTTNYLGLSLKNPIVASAGPLTGDVDTIRRLEEVGVAAAVLPSLFEEQINHDQQRIHAIVGNEFERRGPDDAGRQVGGESGKARALVGGAEQIGVVGHEIAQLRARIEHDAGRRAASGHCVAGHFHEGGGGCRGALPQERPVGARHEHVRVVARAIGDLGRAAIAMVVPSAAFDSVCAPLRGHREFVRSSP